MRHPFALPIVVVALAACIFAGCDAGGQDRPYPPDDPRYCTWRYRIDDGRVPVCASLPLDERALGTLQRQLDEVRTLYPSFADACGVPLDDMPSTLALHVVRYDELNDRAAFPRDERVGNIVGRYYVGRSTVFVTARALDEDGAVHLPHELAHWLHDHAGVDDAEDDERLARAFHRFHRSRTSERERPLLAERVVQKRFGAAGQPLPAHDDEESPPARDRSLPERADGPGPTPLISDVCGR